MNDVTVGARRRAAVRNARPKVGLVAGGLGAYWPQFPDLLPLLQRSTAEVARRITGFGADVVDVGFISDAQDADVAAETPRAAATSANGDDDMTLLDRAEARCETDVPMSPKRNGPAPQVESTAWVPVTIRDVAKMAGVSTGTVSNVLNRPDIVAEVTRQRVLDAVETTGFIRNTQAYQLRGGRSHTVGVVVLDVSNPFFTEMFRGAESRLQSEGYVLMLGSTDDSMERERNFVRAMEEHRVEGVLITPAAADLATLSGLKTRGVPTVLLDRKATADEFCSVTVDDVRGGELAARHLFETGHAEVVFVNGPITIRQCRDRRQGVRKAVRSVTKSHEVEVTELSVGALTVRHGEEAVERILAMSPRPTAVMCANDLLALGVLRALAARGVRVPDDLAVVGYDDLIFGSMLSPALTSVRQPALELGVAAAELLLDEVRNPDHRHREVRFEPELIVRASSQRAS